MCTEKHIGCVQQMADGSWQSLFRIEIIPADLRLCILIIEEAKRERERKKELIWVSRQYCVFSEKGFSVVYLGASNKLPTINPDEHYESERYGGNSIPGEAHRRFEVLVFLSGTKLILYTRFTIRTMKKTQAFYSLLYKFGDRFCTEPVNFIVWHWWTTTVGGIQVLVVSRVAVDSGTVRSRIIFRVIQMPTKPLKDFYGNPFLAVADNWHESFSSQHTFCMEKPKASECSGRENSHELIMIYTWCVIQYVQADRALGTIDGGLVIHNILCPVLVAQAQKFG